MQTIGFIGLGIMGNPMALNLLQAGYKVMVYNRTADKMKQAIDAGATAAGSPKEIADHNDLIITMVTDSPDVEEVILGRNGVFEGIGKGRIVIDMSTISPQVTRKIAERLAEKDAHMLDAPVSGGDSGAKEGTLAIMVGGEASVFETCLPVFRAMGKSITYVGTHGMGQTVKLCNQILVSVTNMAVCEAIMLAKKSGVDATTMIKATANGAAGSWQLANLGPKMVERDFDPGFMIDLQQKDLHLALEAARAQNIPLPALGLVHQLFMSSQAAGEGREGTQALIKSIERLAAAKG